MKRTIGIALVLAAFAAPVRGQGLEFSGGVNFATLSGSAISNAAQNAGMNFGVDLVLPVGPIGLNLGAGWSQKGVEETATNSVFDLSYIEVPVHLRFPLVGAGPIRLNLIAGPTVGINTGCEVTIGAAAAEACSALAVGSFEATKLEWAGAGGLGLSFSLGGLAYAGIDLKYTLGFTEISEGSALAAKNRTFELSSHLGFGIF